MAKLRNHFVPLNRRAPIQHDMIQVTWIESGVTRTMWKDDFFECFGEDEGKEVLAGHMPHIVATIIDGSLHAKHLAQAQKGSF